MSSGFLGSCPALHTWELIRGSILLQAWTSLGCRRGLTTTAVHIPWTRSGMQELNSYVNIRTDWCASRTAAISYGSALHAMSPAAAGRQAGKGCGCSGGCGNLVMPLDGATPGRGLTTSACTTLAFGAYCALLSSTNLYGASSMPARQLFLSSSLAEQGQT